MQRYDTLIIAGPPGSGKDTNARLLTSEFPDLRPVGTGDLIRAWVKRGSPEALAYAPRLAKRELLDDAQTLNVLQDSLDHLVADGSLVSGKHLLMLNGYPRNPNQAEYAVRLFNILDILELQCADDAVLVNRILNDPGRVGRTDNDPASTRRGIEVYHKNTAPMILQLRAQGIHVQRFNGNLPLMEVYTDISDYMRDNWDRYMRRASTSLENRP